MNRFEFTYPSLFPNEIFITDEKNVCLSDGNKKSNEYGEFTITTHRIFWGITGAFSAGELCLALHMRLIIKADEIVNKILHTSRSKHVILYLATVDVDRNKGIQKSSEYDFIKVSFRDGFTSDVYSIIKDCVKIKRWLISTSARGPNIKLRSGIIGIERNLEEKNRAADESISNAFQDLNNLMSMAKKMVSLSKTISSKIIDKQGDISEDETIRFKMYLMSLGIDDPVTRDEHKSRNEYYISLAKQICDFLQLIVEDLGGIITVSDVFCRVNRARGLELLSPDDLLHACTVMEHLDLPLKLHRFSSGVKILQISGLDGESIIHSTLDVIKRRGSVSTMELSQELGISVIIAKERLLVTENIGKSCRDESISGLRFYLNLL